MSKIAFIGLGNMGGPMAANLVKAGHEVIGFDLVAASREAAAESGVKIAASATEAAAEADVVDHHAAGGQARRRGVERNRRRGEAGALFIDCSTVDVESARKPMPCRGGRPQVGRRARLRRRRRRQGGYADLHVRRGGGSFRRRQADPRGDGQAHRPLRRRRRRTGGEDLQQHDPRRDDDRHGRSFRARREARPVPPGAVRRRLDLVGPELVADHLLSGPRPGAGFARQ